MVIKQILYNSIDYWKIVQIREIVLRIPLRLRFSLAEIQAESQELIFGIQENNQWIGSCQYQILNDEAKMRQVAILNKYKRKGYGKQLVLASMEILKQKGIQKIYCHARATAVPFYENLGFQTVSEAFLEVHIPHFKMQKFM
jgi:predicted GNAT family N-acyltransferase